MTARNRGANIVLRSGSWSAASTACNSVVSAMARIHRWRAFGQRQRDEGTAQRHSVLRYPWGALGRAFALLDAQQFERCFTESVLAANEVLQGEIEAIDGKTVRRSHDRYFGEWCVVPGELMTLCVGRWTRRSTRTEAGFAAATQRSPSLLLRRVALNLLEAERPTRRSLAGKRKDAAWDNDHPLKVLAQQDTIALAVEVHL